MTHYYSNKVVMFYCNLKAIFCLRIILISKESEFWTNAEGLFIRTSFRPNRNIDFQEFSPEWFIYLNVFFSMQIRTHNLITVISSIKLKSGCIVFFFYYICFIILIIAVNIRSFYAYYGFYTKAYSNVCYGFGW